MAHHDPPIDSLSLSDGRQLDLRVSGPDDAVPLVFHHGTPSSAVPFGFLEGAVLDRGLRFVTTSRPGYGGSTRQPGRRVVDVVADTHAVLQAIGAERCYVAGWSGGGPHALACARSLGGVIATLVISGVAPYDADGLGWLDGMGRSNLDEFAAVAEGEAALRTFLDGEAEGLRDITAAAIVESFESLLPPVDTALLDDQLGDDFAATIRHGLRHGFDGWVDDDLAFLAPWGFDLTTIGTPVSIWQGSADLMVPYAHGKWLAAAVPGCHPHLLEGEGHLSVAVGALDAMLDELLGSGG